MTGPDASTVRMAKSADEEALVELCRMHHAETALKDGSGNSFPFSAERVRAMIQKATVRQRNEETVVQSFCGVIGGLGEIEASIYLTRDCLWYSEKPILREVFAIVAPAYRKSSHARALTAFSKIAAACLESNLIAEVTAQRIEAKERYYTRSYGNERFGSFYAFDPNGR